MLVQEYKIDVSTGTWYVYFQVRLCELMSRLPGGQDGAIVIRVSGYATSGIIIAFLFFFFPFQTVTREMRVNRILISVYPCR